MLHTALHWDQRFISLKNENGKSVITHSLKGKIVCKWACLKGQREIIRSGFFEYKEEEKWFLKNIVVFSKIFLLTFLL